MEKEKKRVVQNTKCSRLALVLLYRKYYPTQIPSIFVPEKVDGVL